MFWLVPTLLALFLYGIGQGLVKKNISDVPPATFCLFYVFAKTIINIGFFLTHGHPPPFALEGREFMLFGLLASLLDGFGWILYFESIVAGPITIVGTLSAAYAAPTVIFGYIFLKELLLPLQYTGVALVILGCVGLSYAPFNPENKSRSKIWIPLALGALISWGLSQTTAKYAYSLPNASEVNLPLFNTMGGLLTLGLYGFLKGRHGVRSFRELGKSFIPMGMMAAGDLGVIIATRTGPISLVTPISSAYPVVTMGFAYLALKEKITKLQWACIALVLAGMFLAPGAS